MKSLILIRHAKSSWDFDENDFDRPLNYRGENDAPAMAKRLLQKDIKIDAFVSSPAKRAFTTAACFAEAYKKKPKDIIQVPSLYEPTIEAFYDVIKNLDNDFTTVAVVSHNPTITNFANQLTSFFIDDMPTCAVFAVKAEVQKWEEFILVNKEFLFFDYPKSE